MTLSGLLIRPILFSSLHKRAKCAYFKNDKSQKKKKLLIFIGQQFAECWNPVVK